MPMPYIEDVFFFLLYNFSFIVKNRVFMAAWINIRVFDSIPLVYVSVFMPVPSCFYYCSSITELKVRIVRAASEVPFGM